MAGRLTLDFLKTESAAGLAPVGAAAVALILANSPLGPRYFAFLGRPIVLQLGGFAHTASVESWVRDGLMTAFFLVIGLEIKFEVLRGELSSPRRLATPILAAVGGMAVPALIYLACNLGSGGRPPGWPIPVATDVAFALAALTVVSPRLPPSLRLFLLTLAIADDFGAVALIGILFTAKIHWAAAAGAGAMLAALASLSRFRRAPLLLYAVGFAVVWGFCLKSGINTSLAGVACALTVPIGARRPGGESLLMGFMEAIHPWVAWGVLPLFAFTAAGFSIAGLAIRDVFSPVTLGIVLALVIGKPVGVFGVSVLAAVLKVGRRPAGATWLELLGVAAMTGIGFSMSLFLGTLALGGDGAVREAQIRLGVISASLISVAIGAALLAVAAARRLAAGEEI
ncbi:MAG TPA: Na+/H+ antiporter NhaA [Caulobacteraceae bacterium]|jgi:NhaA family Na+:H+ antiporter|nr:Na+/H+ antiporter NhaA [Caulobacteraceae bacterium]